MQPRSARGDSKVIVARSAVDGARRTFELDPTGSSTLAAWSTYHQMNGAPKANFIANLFFSHLWVYVQLKFLSEAHSPLIYKDQAATISDGLAWSYD